MLRPTLSQSPTLDPSLLLEVNRGLPDELSSLRTLWLARGVRQGLERRCSVGRLWKGEGWCEVGGPCGSCERGLQA